MTDGIRFRLSFLSAIGAFVLFGSNSGMADPCDGNWKITIETLTGTCNQGRGQKIAGVKDGRISAVSRHGTAFKLSGFVTQCQTVEFTLTTDNGEYATGSGRKMRENWFSGTWAVVQGKNCKGS